MTADGVVSVTTPSGVTRISRPPGFHQRPRDLLRLASERGPTPDDDADPPPF